MRETFKIFFNKIAAPARKQDRTARRAYRWPVKHAERPAIAHLMHRHGRTIGIGAADIFFGNHGGWLLFRKWLALMT